MSKRVPGPEMPGHRRVITYRAGYKYQLASMYAISTFIVGEDIKAPPYLWLTSGGRLGIRAGYAWDGPSGPVIDTKQNMRASLVHDALYQLMRNGHLSAKKYKDIADRMFMDLCIQDGVPKKIAKAYYLGLKLGGRPSTEPRNQKEVHIAP